MLTGKVKWFNNSTKRIWFYFLSQMKGKKDIFIHIFILEKSGINSLNENDKVSIMMKKKQWQGFSNYNIKIIFFFY